MKREFQISLKRSDTLKDLIFNKKLEEGLRQSIVNFKSKKAIKLIISDEAINSLKSELVNSVISGENKKKSMDFIAKVLRAIKKGKSTIIIDKLKGE